MPDLKLRLSDSIRGKGLRQKYILFLKVKNIKASIADSSKGNLWWADLGFIFGEVDFCSFVEELWGWNKIHLKVRVVEGISES